MKYMLAGLVAGLVMVQSAPGQSSDFPGASDMRSVTRPAKSYLIGAMHIDDDEYQVPLGPVAQGATTPGKSVIARGPVDVVAYAGPTTASSLTTYSKMAVQLTSAGYTEVWSCVRKTCGNPYALVGLMAQPLVDSIHTGEWAGWIINDLYTSNEDVRFGTFKKGAEYVMVMGVLAPGHPSGAMVVRANGPAGEPVLVAPAAAAQEHRLYLPHPGQLTKYAAKSSIAEPLIDLTRRPEL